MKGFLYSQISFFILFDGFVYQEQISQMMYWKAENKAILWVHIGLELPLLDYL